MSDSEKTNKTGTSENSSVELLPIKRSKKLEKKQLTPTKGRISKPAKQHATSPRMRAKQVALGTTLKPQQQHRQQQKKSSDSFYRGALVGSFLGATLSTVITNSIAKLLG